MNAAWLIGTLKETVIVCGPALRPAPGLRVPVVGIPLGIELIIFVKF